MKKVAHLLDPWQEEENFNSVALVRGLPDSSEDAEPAYLWIEVETPRGSLYSAAYRGLLDDSPRLRASDAAADEIVEVRRR